MPKPVPPCAGCGYPATARYEILVTTHANPLPTCSLCGKPLAEDGRPMGGPYKRIVLDRGDVI